VLHAAGAGEPVKRILAPADSERAGPDIRFPQGCRVGEPRNAATELAPHSRHPQFVTDDGTHARLLVAALRNNPKQLGGPPSIRMSRWTGAGLQA